MSTLFEMRHIVKHFAGVLANDHVDFEAQRGEIHGLLGENGAGKTTLMNILYGLYQQDHGDILFEGAPVKIATPKHALELGIGMVHQHFRLIPRLTVLENVVLGLKSEAAPRLAGTGALTTIRRKLAETFSLNRSEAEARLIELADHFGLNIHPNAKIWELSVGEQQRVEILKALYRRAKLLILDEPTAVLTPQEVDRLFEMLNAMVAQGYTIIFITHKLNEIMSACHRITVLRQGKLVATVRSVETNHKELARMMVGREVLFHVEKPQCAPGRDMLTVKNLNVLNDKGLQAVNSVSFSVREGEILGIAGVSGNGQRELIEAINGLRRVESGQIFLQGADVTNAHPKEIVARGVGYIPEDRIHVGLATTLPIAENLLLKNQSSPQFNRRGFINYAALNRSADALILAYDVRGAGARVRVGQLSGGNIQKIILAREISRNPKALIASQPTRGLDVGAIEYVQQLLLEQKRQGKAILLISENLDETLHLSDRIAVMYEGRIVRILDAAAANRREIGLMMAGSRHDA